MQQQGAFQPGDYNQSYQQAYQNVMGQFELQNRPQFEREQQAVEAQIAQRGIDPTGSQAQQLRDQIYQRQEQARQQESQSMLSKLMGSTTSPSEARTAAQNETGINPANYFAEEKAKIAEIEVLTQEYNSVKAAMEQQIAGSYDKMASNNFISNQQAQITRNAAPKLNMLSANINSKAAVLQALQGRFNEAQNYVNQAVQDATADTKYQMDIFSTFYQMNQDSINRLDSIYQDSFKISMDLATTAYEQQYAEKTEIGKLMMDNPKAGISITDSLASAYAKVANSGGSLAYQQQQRLASGSGGGGSGTLTTSQQKNLSAYLGEVPKYKSREEALTAVNQYKEKIVLDTGQEGYNQLIAAIDRQFPATTTTSTSTNNTSTKNTDIWGNPTTSNIGSLPLVELAPFENVINGIGSWFKGLIRF